jgi:hypothetical protein
MTQSQYTFCLILANAVRTIVKQASSEESCFWTLSIVQCFFKKQCFGSWLCFRLQGVDKVQKARFFEMHHTIVRTLQNKQASVITLRYREPPLPPKLSNSLHFD